MGLFSRKTNPPQIETFEFRFKAFDPQTGVIGKVLSTHHPSREFHLLIWTYMGERYGPAGDVMNLTMGEILFSMPDSKWLPYNERVALTMTFTSCYVLKADFVRTGDYLHKLSVDHNFLTSQILRKRKSCVGEVSDFLLTDPDVPAVILDSDYDKSSVLLDPTWHQPKPWNLYDPNSVAHLNPEISDD